MARAILAVAGHLAALQALGGILVWMASPWPLPSLLAMLVWLAAGAADLHHPRLAGHLPRRPLALALALAESPALAFGAWNILHFLGLAPRCELGAVVLQLWLAPLAPLVALSPSGTWLQRDLWLWALSLAPFLLVAAGMLCRRRPPALDPPSAGTPPALTGLRP